MAQITLELFKKLNPSCRDSEKFVDAINIYCPKFGIDTPNRIAMFLAQAMHESAHFTRFVENLNYSATGLANTWPNRFGVKGADGRYIRGKHNAKAGEIARDQRKIANSVYASRMGNGPEDSGDGWLYRGRGIFQLTGLDNYNRFVKDNPEIDIVKCPDLATNPYESVIVACWYWAKGNPTGTSLNKYADRGDVAGCTKKINGGVIGLSDRLEMYKRVLGEIKDV